MQGAMEECIDFMSYIWYNAPLFILEAYMELTLKEIWTLIALCFLLAYLGINLILLLFWRLKAPADKKPLARGTFSQQVWFWTILLFGMFLAATGFIPLFAADEQKPAKA